MCRLVNIKFFFYELWGEVGFFGGLVWDVIVIIFDFGVDVYFFCGVVLGLVWVDFNVWIFVRVWVIVLVCVVNLWFGLCLEFYLCLVFLWMVCVIVCERRVMVWGSFF